jgi:curved DNA-binding protein CbpA
MTQDSTPDPALEDSDADLVIEDDGEDELEEEVKGKLSETPAPGEGVVLPDGTQLGITPEQQARIDLLYDSLEKATYYELLQVSKDAPAKAVKRAYYKLSREFHPDRFFRRELSTYKPKLEQVFAKVNEAYRVLSEPESREDYDASIFAKEVGQTGQLSMATHEVTFSSQLPLRRAREPGQVQSKRKKASTPAFLKKAQKDLTDRLRKARKAFLMGQRKYEGGEFEEAAGLFQRAMMLDPKNKEAGDKFRLSLERGRNSKAEEHWLRGQESIQREQYQEAAGHFSESVACKPTKGKYYFSFGRLVWEHTMRHRTAIELLRTAVEKEPNRMEFLVELGRAYESVGMPTSALKAFERAVRIDPDNDEVKKALKRLR